MPKKILFWLSGLPLTLFGLSLLFIGIFPVISGDMSATLSLSPGYSILFVNLILAILVREKIRHNLPLLIFHIALLLIMLSIAISRLTYFKGWAIISEGEILRQPTGVINQGPWHRNKLHLSPIRQLGFSAFFDENGRRLDTESWIQGVETESATLVSNKETADIAGYQFTVSRNNGFSVGVNWVSNEGNLVAGLIQLPSQISHPETQGVEINLPEYSEPLWLGLEIESDRKSFFYPEFRVPESYHYNLTLNGQLYKLTPGDSMNTANGTLTLNALVPWIGYELYYDPAIYFILIASIVAVFALGYFLNHRMNEKHWIQEDEK